MLASFDRAFIFFHIPKTGGTSVRAALAPHAASVETLWINRCLAQCGIRVNHYLGSYRGYRFRFHQQAKTVQKRLPDQVFSDAFKFCFVRNPWDLLHSHFNFIRSQKNHKRPRSVAQMDFSTFIDYAIDKEIGRQAMRVCDESGNLLVDFVGRFETLGQDFERISDRLRLDLTLPHRNRCAHGRYLDGYDKHSRSQVERAYAEDIERFGYTFDGAL